MGPAVTLAQAIGLRTWRSRAGLVAYQEERLRRVVAHAHAKVPYYRELFDRHGVDPARFRGLADLGRIPISAKNDLRHQTARRVLAAGYDPARLRRIQTTGSTGEPFVLYRGLAEKWRHQLFWLRAKRQLGQRFGDRVVHIAIARGRAPGKVDPVGGLLRAAGMRSHDLDVSRPAEQLLRELAALRPGLVVSYLGMLAQLGEALRQSGREDIRPRFLASGGEVLTRARRRQIEAGWQAPVHELYGCWEADLVAWQCRSTGLFHVCDDSLLLEVVRDGRAAAPGERGEVVLTSLHGWAMPLIRYRLGDLVTRGPETCPCGQPFGTIAAIQGRMLDLFRLPDGRLITEMRTAAVSAVATRAMAAADAKVLAILGSGVQARSHVEALRLVRGFEEIRVWGRTPAHAERFAAEVGAWVMGAEEAVRGADVVVTATSAKEPVLRGAWLKPGAHVNSVGWSGPKGRELDDEVMRNLVVVDSRETVLREAGDVLLSGSEIHAELGEVLAGAKPVPPGATTVFKSVGMAVEDVAAAKLVHDRLQIQL